MNSVLILADGRTFAGRGFGAPVLSVGEVVFNTSMTGYQEILTDPSYNGQHVVMTQPLIGNYGVNDEDIESHSRGIFASGFIVREASSNYSNQRATGSLDDYLKRHNIAAIDRLDTRALTRHLRDKGAMPGAIAPASMPREEVMAAIAAWGSMDGKDLTGLVTCKEPYTIDAEGASKFTLCAWDYGAKQNIFRSFAKRGLTTHVFPASTPASELLAKNPDGIFLSNGPGDPAACTTAIANIKLVLGQKPLMGICLGHQLLALAIGATTYKLPFGHHGGNHPVQDLTTGKIEITAQNHGFAVDEASLSAKGGLVTHINLNDRSVEGLTLPHLRAFSVQYHPEAAPGPHDADYLFDRFVRLIERDG